MVNGSHHPWVLAGPWYRWPQPNVPASGRVSRPVFQKYESANFVNEFLKDPQHSLKFLDPEDFAQEARVRVPALPPVAGKEQSLSKNIYVSTGVRKLFLDTHKRFYLVVCELHCDAAGFPNVDREQACEAGFVVRRRTVDIPRAAAPTATKLVQDLALATAQIAQIDELPPGKKAGPLAGARAAAAAKYSAATAELQFAAKTYGIRLILEGWIKSAFDRVGSWQAVTDTPPTVKEDILPLYPLIADPRVAQHSGGGRTLYFGVVPTGSADTDATGNARYDDNSLYEVRCFVRHHDPRCPKTRARNDCHGELIWSQRSETYRLAAHFDLVGTSNRPVTIQLPDIPALEAQAAALPIGQGAPVRMVSPPGSPNFKVDTSTLKASKLGPSAQICSFSIPLITIVATFVFNLFLPVLTFVLGLFFLLKLKFCIPPTVSLSAGVAAGLSGTFGADIKAGLDAGFTPALEADIAGGLAKDFSSSVPVGVPVDPAPATAVSAQLPSVTATLVFEPRVDVEVGIA
jgi:hypothetical protein